MSCQITFKNYAELDIKSSNFRFSLIYHFWTQLIIYYICFYNFKQDIQFRFLAVEDKSFCMAVTTWHTFGMLFISKRSHSESSLKEMQRKHSLLLEISSTGAVRSSGLCFKHTEQIIQGQHTPGYVHADPPGPGTQVSNRIHLLHQLYIGYFTWF